MFHFSTATGNDSFADSSRPPCTAFSAACNASSIPHESDCEIEMKWELKKKGEQQKEKEKKTHNKTFGWDFFLLNHPFVWNEWRGPGGEGKERVRGTKRLREY